jgi:molybdopterin synthase catalytic subunit
MTDEQIPTCAVQLVTGPLPAAAPWDVAGAGAVICFDGVVRPQEGEATIAGLDYEAYEPMAQQELARLGQATITRFGLLGLLTEHSRGHVPAGACSFRLRIASRHRAEGLAAMAWFIDRLKQDVPIWKRVAAPVPAQEGSP